MLCLLSIMQMFTLSAFTQWHQLNVLTFYETALKLNQNEVFGLFFFFACLFSANKLPWTFSNYVLHQHRINLGQNKVFSSVFSLPGNTMLGETLMNILGVLPFERESCITNSLRKQEQINRCQVPLGDVDIQTWTVRQMKETDTCLDVFQKK